MGPIYSQRPVHPVRSDTEETRMENWVEFQAGATKFALHAVPSEIADQIEILVPPRPREKNPIKLSFEVDDVASERQRLESLGVYRATPMGFVRWD